MLATDQAGPPAALAQLKQLGIKVTVLPGAATLDALEQRVQGVASALGLPDNGGQMVARIRQQVTAQTTRPSNVRTLFVMNRSGKLEGAGKDSTADAMLTLAGARNVLAAQSGYKPLSAEAALALAPDAIVTTRMSIDASGACSALWPCPAWRARPPQAMVAWW